MGILKNTAGQKVPFFWGDSNGSPIPDASLTATVSLDGADYAATTGTITQAASKGGLYVWAPSQADTNGDTVAWKITDGSYILLLSVPWTEIAGAIPRVAAGSGAGLATASAVAAIPTNPLTSLGTNAPAGWLNSAAFAAGATLPRVTLVDTLTTYTGNTLQTGDAYARIGLAGAGLTNLGDTRLAHLDADMTSRASQTSVNALPTLAPDNAGIAAIKAKTDNLPATPAATGDAMALTPAERTTLVAALFAYVTEGTTTFVQAVRGMAGVLLGKASGLATTTAVYRDLADTKDRVTATVDADGNRTSVLRDLS